MDRGNGMSEPPDVPGSDPVEAPETGIAAGAGAAGAGVPGAAGSEAQDAPWWREPHSGAGPWWGHGSPGGSEREAGNWQAGQHGQGAQPGGAGGVQPGQPGQPGPGSPGAWERGSWGPPGGWGQAGHYGEGHYGGQWVPPGGGWGPPGGWGGHGGFGWGPQHTGPSERDLRRRRVLRGVGAGVLTALALMIGIGIGYGAFNPSSSTPHHSRGVTAGGTASTNSTSSATTGTSTGKTSSASGAPSNMAAIASRVDAGLVDINTVLGYQTEEAAGTGMVLTSTGKVLTNNHVVEGSTRISVTDLGNHKTYAASVLGYSKTLDVAVIQLKGASGLQTVKLGDSSTVKVGQAVVGIGNAGGTGGSPSVAGGSVTALNQAITASDSGSLGTTTEHLTGLIQTNAHIQPGDSGGPLVATSGRVVGMDTAASTAQGFSFRGASTGQGYSIPINTAYSAAKQIIEGRQTSTVHVGGTPFIGVYIANSATTRHSNTPFGGFGIGSTTPTQGTTSSTPGAAVQGVISGTPAARSGLGKGDVITNISGKTVGSASDMTKILLQDHPGQIVSVTWTSPDGQSHTANITLAAGPAD